MKIDLYGFDSGEGLPPPKDYRDFPHYFKTGNYKMDGQELRARLNRAKLIIGNVRDTCIRFFADRDAAPVGCVFHDLDFYSSTRDALTLFDEDHEHFLPRIFMYFDDINGDNTWLVSEFAGQLLAVDEFNRNHPFKKIAANRSMRRMHPDQDWRDQIYVYHDYQHPKYNVFIAGEEQRFHEKKIALG